MLRMREPENGKLELKMTSMIDVVFLLLIFFLVTLSIPREEGAIETTLARAPSELDGRVPPEVEDKQKELPDVLLHISRTAAGRVRKELNMQPVLNDGMLLERLTALREASPDGCVVIHCNADVPYAEMVNAIGIVQMARLKIAIAGLHG